MSNQTPSQNSDLSMLSWLILFVLATALACSIFALSVLFIPQWMYAVISGLGVVLIVSLGPVQVRPSQDLMRRITSLLFACVVLEAAMLLPNLTWLLNFVGFPVSMPEDAMPKELGVLAAIILLLACERIGAKGKAVQVLIESQDGSGEKPIT